MTISTRRYFMSHMKEPRGKGYWLFETKSGEIVSQTNDWYAEAKKQALKVAKARGETLYTCS